MYAGGGFGQDTPNAALLSMWHPSSNFFSPTSLLGDLQYNNLQYSSHGVPGDTQHFATTPQLANIMYADMLS